MRAFPFVHLTTSPWIGHFVIPINKQLGLIEPAINPLLLTFGFYLRNRGESAYPTTQLSST